MSVLSRSVPRLSIHLAMRAGTGFLAAWLLAGIAPLWAATYHVSPTGDDAKNGLSPATAWKTAGKVNAAKFAAGDRILFARGGEWRESLVASSSGAAGNPITYDAYGKGAKPKFYGSDLLTNAKFTPAGGNNYNYPMPTRADSALENQVFIASTWNNGALTITTSGTDPRTNGKTYTACTRGNVIFSARKDHLVFRNLVADETAGQIGEGAVQGYGVRIEGSTDVLVENCEANRCGRHNFGVINSTGFVGRHLHAEYVQPKTPGGNSIYVSYADGGAPVASCTSEWDDITAAHLEDGSGGQYPFFVSHGERQGLITMKNAVATTKISFMSGPVIFKGGTLRENASIENWGTGALIDGVTLLDSAAIDQWASDGVIQNCVAHLTPERGGPTGFSTAVLCRDKAKRNVVRFNTLVTKNFSCLAMGGADSATKWYGNIMLSDGVAVYKASALGAADAASADYNFYAPTATFAGATLDAWKSKGFDAHSKTGDPKFVDPAGGNYGLQATSPCIAAAGVNAADVPPTDAAGTARRPAAGKGYDMGAFASGSAPASSPTKALPAKAIPAKAEADPPPAAPTAPAAGPTAPQAEARRVVTVAPFLRPPQLDGKIEPGEWDGAVGVSGFQGPDSHRLEARAATAFCGFTETDLYIAVVSDLPPDGQVGERTRRDSDVIFDESVELWLDPDPENRAAGKSTAPFFQFIGNPLGAIYDARLKAGGEAADVGWDPPWRFVNRVDKASGKWVAELAIPFKELGWADGPAAGRSLGVLIARNFKRPWNQATWFAHTGHFGNGDFVRLRLTKDAPAVQLESLGEKIFRGEPVVQLRLWNPGPAREARVRLRIQSSDMPDLAEDQTVALAAASATPWRFAVPAGRLHELAQHQLELQVTDKAAGDPLFDYAIAWAQAPERMWDVRIGPDEAAAVRIGYYPSYRRLRYRVDPSALKDGEKVRAGQVVVEGADGRKVAEQEFRWEKGEYENLLALPDLPDGVYKATFRLAGIEKPLVRTFERKRFPWEGNRLGITNKVYPPFTPVVVKGDEVQIVGRRYQVGGLGLWKSVVSLDRELLAAPVTLRIGDERPLEGAGRFTKTDPDAVVYEGEARHPAVTIKTRCTTEFDGCLKVELELGPTPEGRELPSLRLEIPLKDAEAPLWHVCTTGIRSNPAGAVPPGSGTVWDSRRFPDGTWNGNFKPYFWLGAERRGISWFADNDAGWELDMKDGKAAPCLELIRQGGVLTLRVNLVQKPVRLKAARRIVFGLMASPAKPMPENWRRMLVDFKHTGCETLGWIGSEYWGADSVFAAKYPRNHDLSVLDAMRDARAGRPVDIPAFLEGWVKRNLAADVLAPVKEHYLYHIGYAIRYATQGQKWFSVYWEECHSTTEAHPETHLFQSEWSGGYQRDLLADIRTEDDFSRSLNTAGLVPSYRDFACWWGNEFVRRGIGLYLDNVFPKQGKDPLTTAAYVMADGSIQPSAGIWNHREYLKRLWNIHQEWNRGDQRPMLVLHMTNSLVLPYMSFSQTNLDLEWHYGPEPQQSKYPIDLLRAESLGLQSGSLPMAMATVEKTRSDDERKKIERTRFGVLFVHEIRPSRISGYDLTLWEKALDFGYGRDDCRVFNYWDEPYPVRIKDGNVKSILLVRPDRALLVLCTWNPAAATAEVALDASKVGFSVTNVVDEETGETIRPAGDAFSVPLEGYGVRLLRLEGKPSGAKAE